MTQEAKKDNGFQPSIFYKTEDALLDEISRYLGTIRKNRGAREWSICHVVNNRPFAQAYDEAKQSDGHEKFRTKRDMISWFAGLRRAAIFPVVRKLLNEGYSVAEISDALTIPYSTAYYYAKKIKNHKRFRPEATRWHLDVSGKHIVPVKLPKDKEAALARKEIIRKAQAKRARKAEKLKAIREKQQADHAATKGRDNGGENGDH